MVMAAIKSSALVFIVSFLYVSGFAQDSGNPGRIAPELVGKWCYVNPANGGNTTPSSTCITLNGDGSYEFFLDDTGMARANSFFPGATLEERDLGTWSALGSTIYYNSYANGQGSFQFQKVNQPQRESTPMIVVSGQAFASETPRDPW